MLNKKKKIRVRKLGGNKSPYLIAIKEQIRNNDKRGDNGSYIKDTNSDKTLSPLSGYEPRYSPNRWNDKDNIRDNHNCYAYALNKIAYHRSDKSQPGYFSGFPPLSDKDYNCATFLKRLKKDIPGFYVTSFNDKCRSGFYKAFLALDEKYEDQDYHFYRQDNSGYWSHKPGRTEATNIDASGNLIKNPLIADRKYRHFEYSTPCFFFCLNSKLSSLHSRYED